MIGHVTAKTIAWREIVACKTVRNGERLPTFTPSFKFRRRWRHRCHQSRPSGRPRDPRRRIAREMHSPIMNNVRAIFSPIISLLHERALVTWSIMMLITWGLFLKKNRTWRNQSRQKWVTDANTSPRPRRTLWRLWFNQFSKKCNEGDLWWRPLCNCHNSTMRRNSGQRQFLR